jgi:hypothetical protein
LMCRFSASKPPLYSKQRIDALQLGARLLRLYFPNDAQDPCEQDGFVVDYHLRAVK